MNVEGDLVARNLLVGKYAYKVSGDRAAVLPARLNRELAGVLVQFRGGDIDVLLKEFLAFREPLFDVAAQLLFQRVAANNVRAAKIGLSAAPGRINSRSRISENRACALACASNKSPAIASSDRSMGNRLQQWHQSKSGSGRTVQ